MAGLELTHTRRRWTNGTIGNAPIAAIPSAINRFSSVAFGLGVKYIIPMRMLHEVSPRRKQVYTMIGHEPFDVCMERIQRVIAWGGEPYAQPFMQLNTLEKRAKVRHDWTELRLRQVARWVNRHIWRKTPFARYNASAKTPRAIDETWDGTLFADHAT